MNLLQVKLSHSEVTEKMLDLCFGTILIHQINVIYVHTLNHAKYVKWSEVPFLTLSPTR